jgi:hypothetical protein
LEKTYALYSAFAIGTEVEGYSISFLGSYEGDAGRETNESELVTKTRMVCMLHLLSDNNFYLHEHKVLIVTSPKI